jgi:hypothetical protein
MKNTTFQSLIKKGFLTTAFLAFTILGFSQKKEEVVNSLTSMLNQKFNKSFSLDSTLSQGCKNHAKEKYYCQRLPFSKGQAHYHSSLNMYGDPVIPTLRTETIVNDFSEMLDDEFIKGALTDTEVSRFWIEEVQINDRYFLVLAVE